MPLTNLDLVNQCDSFPYADVNSESYLASINTYYQLRVSGHNYALGYMLPSVVEVFRGVPNWEVDDDARILYLTGGSNADERSKVVETTLLAMRETGHFKVLDKWRAELYAVYGKDKELLFNVERSASALFGVVTYGVHLTAFTRKNGELKVWTPRRAKTKQTYGGMLDNAVAGGIASGESPFESLVRECGEEASLPEELVRPNAKACGTVTYWYIRDERAGGETNLMQPEVQYIYDLELPEGTIPKPGDDEVDEFYLWSVEEVQEAMRKGEFKPNCALVVLDFLVRHGILTTENERDYIEIVSRLHRKLEFPTL
ncbi:thiamine pyrophosphokinase [Pyrenophora tritici-repentis]|uniref:NUDIX domain containing protein n=2 Tax=Pyrenophora tritici-repentis TaxID=45151 RepID=A0A2W1EGG8_9PLEO|nr:thiamine pyrophosphokinase [Pyrenophora tritici-repentis Pt-1C-BFP]KAA8627643.1 Thiamine pyrophosphokinase [Pyrenophora tritici-repentis]EDU42109.1 thiamine pyrophosphokinase [Pyrenophora tritici-repentis Pt-1C-BFP]KAF7442327.1 Thiamine pyrophosphokinase [Pyrenophora tritici-repentis]KAF7579299.1 NUDIX domain containing protein [Pyrenophora tritici-repentis]KAG9378227.1 Thiamine pyrophosphokinase [Pyrenophora tritici-repentis]